ncbi:MAG TPA: (2Fe-2S)-binding protein [Acidimicrobiia bacterium]|nr:(2Fe-2S)-binding protein [Acidimicrobiia bacterium]
MSEEDLDIGAGRLRALAEALIAVLLGSFNPPEQLSDRLASIAARSSGVASSHARALAEMVRAYEDRMRGTSLAARLEPNTYKHRFLSVVAHGPGISNTEVGRRLGLNDESAVSRAGRQLLDVGVVSKTRYGRVNGWEITPLGQEVLAILGPPRTPHTGQDPSRRHVVSMTVNGQRVEREVEARLLLIHFLREDLGLTGSHIGCESGYCGACTVLLDDHPVKACMMLTVQAQDCVITTIEGLAPSGGFHPVQDSFWRMHAVQCGFCTPGMILQAVGLLMDNPSPSEAEIREGLAGNLCGCTGYHNIVRAVQDAAERIGGDGPSVSSLQAVALTDT